MSTAIPKMQTEATTILVENLPDDMREEDIRSLFSQYGPVSSIRVIPGIASRRGDNCCYLTMRGHQATGAISALDGKAVMGSILRICEAQEQPGAFSKAPRAAEDEHRRGLVRLVYGVASVEKAEMPAGSEGGEWYRYVLSSGSSRITGFHRGSRAEVEEYAVHCAEELNLRSIRGKRAHTMAPPKKK